MKVQGIFEAQLPPRRLHLKGLDGRWLKFLWVKDLPFVGVVVGLMVAVFLWRNWVEPSSLEPVEIQKNTPKHSRVERPISKPPGPAKVTTPHIGPRKISQKRLERFLARGRVKPLGNDTYIFTDASRSHWKIVPNRLGDSDYEILR